MKKNKEFYFKLLFDHKRPTRKIKFVEYDENDNLIREIVTNIDWEINNTKIEK